MGRAQVLLLSQLYLNPGLPVQLMLVWMVRGFPELNFAVSPMEGWIFVRADKEALDKRFFRGM